MNIHKKIEKFWSGSVSFTAIETFKDLNAAVEASVPTTAAKIIVDNNSLSYDFKRIKEVNKTDGDNALRTPGPEDPGERKGEKKVEQKDNNNVKK